MAQDCPLSLCLSPVCFLCLKEAFCWGCQGLLEPESTQGCGCSVPESREASDARVRWTEGKARDQVLGIVFMLGFHPLSQ